MLLNSIRFTRKLFLRVLVTTLHCDFLLVTHGTILGPIFYFLWKSVYFYPIVKSWFLIGKMRTIILSTSESLGQYKMG